MSEREFTGCLQAILPGRSDMAVYAQRAFYAELAKALSSKEFGDLVDLVSGDVVQLVRTLPCHGRGRGFESRRPRHSFQTT
jgi:hypothetical protein